MAMWQAGWKEREGKRERETKSKSEPEITCVDQHSLLP